MSDALDQINSELQKYQQTTYFASFLKGPQKPKETYKSYQDFLAKSMERRKVLAKFSEDLCQDAYEQRNIAKKVLADEEVDSSRARKLFLPQKKPVIPRSQYYQKICRTNDGKLDPQAAKEELRMRRLLASTYNSFARQRGFDFTKRKPEGTFLVKPFAKVRPRIMTK